MYLLWKNLITLNSTYDNILQSWILLSAIWYNLQADFGEMLVKADVSLISGFSTLSLM